VPVIFSYNDSIQNFHNNNGQSFIKRALIGGEIIPLCALRGLIIQTIIRLTVFHQLHGIQITEKFVARYERVQ
jgi:hypothetical protein